MVLSLTTLKLVAAVPSKLTAVAPVKPVPTILTAVPPPMSPLLGDTLATVGPSAVVE